MTPPKKTKSPAASRFDVIDAKCLECEEVFEVRGQALVDLKKHAGVNGNVRLKLL